jgi:hypothetical protein
MDEDSSQPTLHYKGGNTMQEHLCDFYAVISEAKFYDESIFAESGVNSLSFLETDVPDHAQPETEY